MATIFADDFIVTTPSSATLLRNPRLRFFDTYDLPLVGGSLYTCPPGSPDISTLKASWQDYAKSILNPNPIILDSSGYSLPIFSDATYKIFVYDSKGNLISATDNVWSTTLGLVQLAAAPYQFWDANGNLLEDGKLYTCYPGAATTQANQLKASYSDAGLSTLNDNPIALDDNGQCTIYSATDFYKLFLTDANDVPILTQDDVGPS